MFPKRHRISNVFGLSASRNFLVVTKPSTYNFKKTIFPKNVRMQHCIQLALLSSFRGNSFMTSAKKVGNPDTLLLPYPQPSNFGPMPLLYVINWHLMPRENNVLGFSLNTLLIRSTSFANAQNIYHSHKYNQTNRKANRL